MPSAPSAPRIEPPHIDPRSIIENATKYIADERWKFYLIVVLAIVGAAYALWIIYEEYSKSPIKIRKLRWGKFKLSDFIRRK